MSQRFPWSQAAIVLLTVTAETPGAFSDMRPSKCESAVCQAVPFSKAVINAHDVTSVGSILKVGSVENSTSARSQSNAREHALMQVFIDITSGCSMCIAASCKRPIAFSQNMPLAQALMQVFSDTTSFCTRLCAALANRCIARSHSRRSLAAASVVL